MKNAGLAVAVMSLALAGCDSTTSPDPVPGGAGWRETQVVAVHEAVHRQQFAEHAPGAQPEQVTFCLAQQDATGDLPWTDPPEALLFRFVSHVPTVKKVSQCHVSVRGDTDPAAARPAIIFRVGPPAWQSDTEVVLDGGYHRGGLDASGQTYRVRYQDRRWQVVEVTWRWIS